MYPDLKKVPCVEDEKKENETGLRKVDWDLKRENLLVRVKEDKDTTKDLHDSFDKNGKRNIYLPTIYITF